MHISVVFFCFLLATTQSVFSETTQIGSVVFDREKGVAVIIGRIEIDTSSDFQQMLLASPDVRLLILDSPGGSVVSALEVASTVASLGIETLVPDEATCASACSIIFFAGNSRLALGRLGVHQMSTPDGKTGDIGQVQFLVSRILDAFEKFGVSRDVSRFMLTTPSSDMYFFDESQKVLLGINRTGEVATILPSVARAKSNFTDYPADRYMSASETIALPNFDGRDSGFRNFRTRIRNGLKMGPNLAGHFSLVEIGCGTSCRFAFVADAQTGQVFEFPYGGEEQYELNLLYNLDSKLVKATWADLDAGECIQQDLAWNGRSFDILDETRFARVVFCNG